MKLQLSVLMSLFLSATAWAQNCKPVAKITAYEGQVSIKPAGKAIKKSPGKAPADLCAGDEVHTFQGKALIKTERDAITLDDNSVLSVKTSNQASVDKGQALFDIQKRQGGQGMQVATRLSVIGVKGTRFLVSDKPESVGVALDEGVVDVKSTQGKLGLFREKEVQKPAKELTFEDMKREMQEGVDTQKQEFEKYKTEIMKEFVAYVESVTMKAGTELVISGNEAVERKTSGNMKSEMDELRKWQKAH